MGWGCVLAASLAVPALTANTYYLYLAMTVAIMVVIAAGLNVLAGLSGQISLGHAGLYAVGAYTGAILATRVGLGLWTALPASIVVTAAVGALLALAALRVSGPYLAMVTIAFGIIVEGAAVEWVALTGGPGGIFDIPKPMLGGFPLTLGAYHVVVVLVAGLAIVATRNLMRSAWGRAFVAVKDAEIAAESLGLSTYRVRTVAFTISAAFAGAGGCLFAFLNGYLSPDSFTLQTSILFLLIVLFGGLGTLAGPLVGAVVLVLLPEFLHGFLEYRLILYGTLLLLSVYFLPRGLVGAVERAADATGGGADADGSGADADGSGADATGGGADATGGGADATGGGADADGSGADATGGGADADVTVRRRVTDTSPPAELQRPISDSRLEVDAVTAAFGGLLAVNRATLTVDAGHVHALIGPNGAGKTTLVNIVAGFYRPDAGSVRFCSLAITGLSPAAVARHGLVRTFQTPQLFDALSVRENVMVGVASHRLGSLAAALLGIGGRDAALAARADAVLDAVGLTGWAEVRASALPFGLRRRLEIARALATGARMLLLDEPAAGLAPPEVGELARLLGRLRDEGRTILLIEHHMELVMDVSDRVTVLDEGRVIAEGPPDAVQRDPIVLEAYLGTA